MNAEELEVVPGFQHEKLQGRVWEPSTDEELCEGLEKAFDYRGDVTITRKDATVVEGYIFDRRVAASLSDSVIRLFPKGEANKQVIRYSDIRTLTFSGRDTAAGKSWEAWLKKYWEKKAAGEKNIELTPDKLD